MIRLEGPTLPRESRGAIPPILFGDLLRDVPGIPLQIGWIATLANNCGVDIGPPGPGETGPTTLWLGGADLAETLAVVPPSGVVQLENEWLHYTAILQSPPRLVGIARGYRETVPAVHAKGTTVYFVETRPLYVLAYVPPGCSYPDDAVVQLRVNDNAQTPPATIRLQDARVVPGVRLVTVEFEASHAFYPGNLNAEYGTGPRATLPSRVSLVPSAEAPSPDPRGTPSGSGPSWMGPAPISVARAGRASGGGRQPVREYHPGRATPAAPPPPPRFPTPAPSPPRAPFADPAAARRITLRQGGALGSVTADLRGLRDTPAGRYTGVGLAPLVQPAAIVRLLLEETYGETDPARYHAPTWTATAAAHAARGITWRLVWAGEAFDPFREAAQLCGQADLYLDEDGRWRYGFRDPVAPAVATLTPRELLEEPALAWTAGRDVITELEVAWGAGLQSGTLTLDSPMRVRHGRNHGGVAFAYAATEAIARQLGQYQLARRDRPRQHVTVRACHATLGLTLADKIHLDTPLLALYAQAQVPFEIIGLTDRGDQRVLVCLEADPLALEIFGAAVGTATVVGSLGEPDTLAGTVVATGTLVGDLAAAAVTFAAAATGTATLAGTLVSAAATLAGTATATGTLDGTLVAGITLAGTATGTATGAGTLTSAAITYAWDAAGATWDAAGATWDPGAPTIPWGVLGSIAAGATNNVSITTAALNTTGADLLIAAVSHYDAGLTGAVTMVVEDSRACAWTPLTVYLDTNAGNASVRLYYTVPTAVGAGHTFTARPNDNVSAIYPSIAILAVSGAKPTAPFDQENGTRATAPRQPGAVTPTEANELVVTACAWENSDLGSIDGGFTVAQTVENSSNHEGVSLAYLIQTTAAVANPMWTMSTTPLLAVAIATFKRAT